MYTQRDYDRANAQVKKVLLVLIIGIAALLALYAFAIVGRMKFLSFAALLAMLLYGIPLVDIWLVPALRYRSFLAGIKEGITRETFCTIESVDAREQLQDGVRVYPVHIALQEEKDTRIFYINISKAEQIPKAGVPVRIERSGRHIVNAAITMESSH